jgi:hypothetical protein
LLSRHLIALIHKSAGAVDGAASMARQGGLLFQPPPWM